MESVSKFVTSVHPTPSSFAFLVYRSGRLIAGAKPGLIMKQATELSPALTPDRIAGLQDATSPVAIGIDGATKLLRAQAIAGTDWSLVLALDQSDLTAGMRAIATTTLLAILAVALVAAARW